jgi:uncharacterized protein (DUF3084 family)
MFWTILALCSLVGLSGFIAYYGDLQGRRWGKRRVSWFGLRPKHTAIVVTTLTGSVIAAISIVSVLAIVPPIRHIITNGETAIRDNRRLVMALQQKERSLQESVRENNNQSRLAQSEITEQRATIDMYRQRTIELRRQIPPLLKQKQLLMRQITEDENLIRVGQARIEAGKRQLARVEENSKQISSQNLTLNRANIDLTKGNRALTDENGRLQRGNANLMAQQNALDASIAKLKHDNNALAEGGRQLAQQAEELHGEVAVATDRLVKAQAACDAAENAQRAAERAYVAARSSLIAMREGKFSLRVGAELARRTVDAHMRPEAVLRELQILLDQASEAARRHGAVEGYNHRAVRIVTKRAVTLAGTLEEDEAACIDAVAENIIASPVPVVVIASTWTNSVEGEQVLIDLSAYFVKPMFQRGARLATIEVNGRQSADALFDQLASFLNTSVRSAALNAGAIPRTDPETGEQRLGELNLHDVLKLTDRIKRMRGQVVVTAVAADSVTCADPVRLRFDLSRPVVPETSADERSR